MTNLKPVNTGSNTFCGPAVLSVIDGMNTDEAVAEINAVRHKPKDRKVTGAYLSELVEVLTRRGYKHTYFSHLHNNSLFFVLSVLDQDGMYIVNVPGHFICIEKNGSQRYICDNRSKRPLNAGISSRLQQKAIQIVKVWK